MANVARTILSQHLLRGRSFPEAHLSINAFIAITNTFLLLHEQLTPNSLHIIFAFMIQVVLNLLGVKYQGKANTPFDTHPITMSFGIACFLVYCLAYGFELNCFVSWLSPTHAPQLRRSMVVFGSLSLASFVSVLFPGSVQWILFGIHVLLLMGFLLHAQVKIFWKWIKQRIVARLFRSWERNVRQTHWLVASTVTDQGNILPL